jgi:hypothetical protein
LLTNAGATLMEVVGTDLTVFNDLLQPRGVRTSPPTVSGNATYTWRVSMPWKVSSADMPGQIQVTFSPNTVLTGFTTLPTTQVTLAISVSYATDSDVPSLRAYVASPPMQSGDNYVQAYLPQGMTIEALGFTLSAGDAALAYESLSHGGVLIDQLRTVDEFVENDTDLMQSGHLSGEFIMRIPRFTVDSTTWWNVRLASSSAMRLYVVSTAPQQHQ